MYCDCTNIITTILYTLLYTTPTLPPSPTEPSTAMQGRRGVKGRKQGQGEAIKMYVPWSPCLLLSLVAYILIVTITLSLLPLLSLVTVMMMMMSVLTITASLCSFYSFTHHCSIPPPPLSLQPGRYDENTDPDVMLEMESSEQFSVDVKVQCSNQHCLLLLFARLAGGGEKEKEEEKKEKEEEGETGEEESKGAEGGASSPHPSAPLPASDVLETVTADTIKSFVKLYPSIATASLCEINERDGTTVATVHGLKPGLQYTIYAYLQCTVEDGLERSFRKMDSEEVNDTRVDVTTKKENVDILWSELNADMQKAEIRCAVKCQFVLDAVEKSEKTVRTYSTLSCYEFCMI